MGFVSALKRGRTPLVVLKQFCPESIRLFIKSWNVVRGTRIPKSDIWRFTSYNLRLGDLIADLLVSQGARQLVRESRMGNR